MLKIITYPLLNLKRKIRIYLPVDYVNENIHYPVLFMHDGQNVFTDDEAFGGESLRLEKYLDQQRIPLIVAAIDRNPSYEKRVNEYCPWKNGKFSEKILETLSSAGGHGEAYIDALVNEIKPLIDREFRTLPNQTYMAGISLGGLISTYAACRYPQIFKKFSCLSTAFYRNQEEIEKFIKTSDLSQIEKVYMDCGTKEAGEDDKISNLFLSSNTSVYQLLKNKIPATRFRVKEGAGHGYVFFRERIPEVLSFLCSD